MNKAELLDLAGKIERKMADIYRFFDNLFKENEDSSSLWETMAEEEDAHAGFLDAEYKMVIVSPDSFGLPRVEAEVIEETYDKLEEIEEKIREKTPDLKEAVTIALQMELELVEKNYNRLVDIGDPAIKRIFDELTKGEHHLERLVVTANKLGVKIKSSHSG